MGWVCVLIAFLVTVQSWGQELRFGPEFTFSSDEILAAQRKMPPNVSVADFRARKCDNIDLARAHTKYLRSLHRQFRLLQTSASGYQERAAHSDPRNYIRSFIKENEWCFSVDIDPAVIELKATPMTLEELKKYSTEAERIFFQTAKEIGISPQLFTGGGHINLGLAEFKAHPLLLRNFIVDLLNHSELFMGILGYDTNNAISPWLKPELPQKIVGAMGPGTYTPLDFNSLLTDLMPKLVPYESDQFIEFWRGNTYVRGHGLAFTMRGKLNDVESLRLEIRSVRPQASFDVFIRQAELLQSRLNYLRQFDAPIPLHNLNKLHLDASVRTIALDPPIDPQAALKSFHAYVTESGLKWEDHQDYIWPSWITSGELKRFNESLVASCSDLLASS